MALSDLLVKVGIDSSGFRSGISDLRSQSASLRASMAQMAGTIREQVKELNAMARAGKTGTDEFKKLEQQIKGNEKAFRGMGKEASYLDKQLRGMEGPKMGGMMKDIGGALTGGLIGGGIAGVVTAGVQQLQQTFSETLKVTADFDDQLRKIAATSGATTEEMGMLRDAAIEWGAKSAFSASESAQAMQYMAQAGWSVQQSITGLPAVLNLAASSGESLGNVAEIVTNNLNAFKLGASDATRFADVLAAAAAASSTDVANMGLTFKYVAPLAGALGFSIEDTAIAIGLMANNGIKASQAGTGLSAILANMAKPTAEMQRTMSDLNLSLVDSSGAVKPLRQLINELQDAFAKLTPEQQLQAATSLAGKEAMAELLAMVTSTDAAIASMTQKIDENNGTSQEMADIMEGGVGGSLRRMQGAWESLQLTIAGSGGFARVWYDGWAAVFESWSNGVEAIKKGYNEFRRILQIGLFDALKESEQTAGIEKFGKAYKEALGGFPTDKLTDQMTRLTNTADFQAAAFEKRNAAVMAKLAPPKDLENAVKSLNKELKDGESNANNFAKAIEKISKTASDVFGEVIGNVSNVEDFYAIIGDDLGALEAQHRELQNGMKAAWEAGGYGAANYVLDLKRQDDEMQKLIEGLKKMKEEKWDTPQIQSTQQRIQGGAMQLPGIETANTLKPLIAEYQKQMKEANLLQAAFGDVNMVASEMQSLGQLISEGLEAGLDQTALQGYIDRWKELNAEQEKQAQFAGVMTAVGDAAFNAFQAVGSGAQSASEGVAAFGKAAVSASLDAARAALVEAIMNNTKWLTKTMGPLGIPIALAGVGALFGLMKGAIGKSKGVQLAKGGIISGRTMAEVGEYPGAAFNPEVVAPLDKLQAMLDVGGATHVTGTFRVNGSDLVVALDNAQRKMNKFRV